MSSLQKPTKKYEAVKSPEEREKQYIGQDARSKTAQDVEPITSSLQVLEDSGGGCGLKVFAVGRRRVGTEEIRLQRGKVSWRKNTSGSTRIHRMQKDPRQTT